MIENEWCISGVSNDMFGMTCKAYRNYGLVDEKVELDFLNIICSLFA